MRTESLVLLGALAVPAACAANDPIPAYPDPARSAPLRDPILTPPLDVGRIAAALAAHRLLSDGSPVTAITVDKKSLADRFEHGLQGSPEEADAVLQALGFAAPGIARAAALRPLYAKDVAGFYDRRTKTIWLGRDSTVPERTQTWATIHETEHALQDRASVLRHHAKDVDEDIAYRALIEGDAELTTAAFLASRNLTFDHWLSGVLVQLGKPLPDEPAAADERSPEARVWRFARIQWSFPYIDGMRLVASVYRAGGYPLVNRMFEHPPVSSEQVLHPEKYLAGELRIAVRFPAAPDGYRTVRQGRFGELGVRSLFASCFPGEPEPTFGTGWGGDAYTVAANSSGELAILWATAWDDETAARAFELDAGERATCVVPARGGEGKATIVREGTHVAYIRGLSGELATAAAERLLRLPGPPPSAAPPLGDVHLKPIVDPNAFLAQGYEKDGAYVNRPLGLTLSTRGFDRIETTEGSEIALETDFGITHVHMAIWAFISQLTGPLKDRFSYEFVGPLEEAGVYTSFAGEAAVRTGAGEGRELRWRSGLGNRTLVFVPVCRGRITVAVFAGGGGGDMDETIRGFLRHLRFDETSPACRFATED